MFAKRGERDFQTGTLKEGRKKPDKRRRKSVKLSEKREREINPWDYTFFPRETGGPDPRTAFAVTRLV